MEGTWPVGCGQGSPGPAQGGAVTVASGAAHRLPRPPGRGPCAARPGCLLACPGVRSAGRLGQQSPARPPRGAVDTQNLTVTLSSSSPPGKPSPDPHCPACDLLGGGLGASQHCPPLLGAPGPGRQPLSTRTVLERQRAHPLVRPRAAGAPPQPPAQHSSFTHSDPQRGQQAAGNRGKKGKTPNWKMPLRYFPPLARPKVRKHVQTDRGKLRAP